MKKNGTSFAAGLIAGAVLFGGGTAMAGILAEPSTQPIYVDGQQVSMTAYSINGSNYVKLRDVGQAVNFGVVYDAGTNSVYIEPDIPYIQEAAPAPQAQTPAPATGALSKNEDGSINVPSDGSQYVPKVGDVIRCDDGTNYTVTDVSRYDKNYFADGPVGALPEPTCDWSQFDQPELPAVEVRRFQNANGDYLYVRNLYETRRILYTFFNAMGEDETTWKDGKATKRGDGTSWVHIQLSIPDGMSYNPSWPWDTEFFEDILHSCPGGDYYVEAWDVYKDGIFQRTEYDIH